MRVDKGRLGSIGQGEDALERRVNQMQAQLDRMTDVINGGIEFGDPQDPNDATSAAILAGTTTGAGAHNGTPGNIFGAFVELSFTSVGHSDVVCHHNLYLDTPGYTLPVTGEPNVRWLDMGTMHDGTGSNATTNAFAFACYLGGAVTANSIELRFSVGVNAIGALTIGSSNPILQTLFFTRATRGE